jgi:hypothetical protein
MKRATYLQYRDPRQRTPASALPVVTTEGIQLFTSPDRKRRNTSLFKWSRGRRFQEHFEIEKWRGCEPGPQQYRPKNELKDRVDKQPCVKIVKPELIDESKYEIVGGTAKVLRPDLLDHIQQKALDVAARSFISNRNKVTHYPFENPNPEKTSETMLH